MKGNNPTPPGPWRRMSRFCFSRRKISRPIIRRFVRQHASSKRTLVLHPEEGLEHFPDRYVISKRAYDEPDRLIDPEYEGLADIESASFDTILCIGLLEHIADPVRFVGELHRILRPGGRSIMACSSSFSIHEAPRDYFHYTPYGIQRLFRNWSGFEVLRGSCGPFTTIGILLQRILLQCEIFPLLRPPLEALVHVVPVLDRFVTRQYGTVGMDEATVCDTMLPSNIHFVVLR